MRTMRLWLHAAVISVTVGAHYVVKHVGKDIAYDAVIETVVHYVTRGLDTMEGAVH